MKDKEYYEGLDKRTREYKEYAKFNRFSNEPERPLKYIGLSPEDKMKLANETLNSATDMIDWDVVYQNKFMGTDSKIEGLKGLGNTIENITKATGIKKIVELFADGKDCGCDKRKETLNKLFPYKRQPKRCLTESQYNQYKTYRETRTLNVWNESDIKLLIDTYAHVFAIQYNSKTLCRSCAGSGKILFRISKELDIVFESYNKK